MTNYVVTTLDDVPETGPVTPDGQVSLREAIRAANTNAQVGDAPAGQPGVGPADQVDTITFDSSLQGSTLNIPHGVLNITDDLVITGPGSSQLTIDAQTETGIFDVSGSIMVSLSGLTLTNGFATDGGAIYNAAANLTLNDVVISGSSAVGTEGGGQGGGLYNGSGNVTITNSSITGNSASYGGAVFSDGGLLEITASSFTANTAGSYGGAIYNQGGTVSAENSRFFTNSATYGGAAWNASEGSASFRSSTFSQNSASINGGALGITSGASLTLVNSTVSGNTANSLGGGIDNESNLTVVNSTIVANRAYANESISGAAGNDLLFTGGMGNDPLTRDPWTRMKPRRMKRRRARTGITSSSATATTR